MPEKMFVLIFLSEFQGTRYCHIDLFNHLHVILFHLWWYRIDRVCLLNFLLSFCWCWKFIWCQVETCILTYGNIEIVCYVLNIFGTFDQTINGHFQGKKVQIWEITSVVFKLLMVQSLKWMWVQILWLE